ncbi:MULTISPECIES: hypothetical protein [unclassified Xanthobacter]|uniref:hypothetical protein n=1 Tax=unclassified Xanthobacter TaxID=2623496 RepID=UPI001F31B021|nr:MULTISPECIES: hypothetical protein [unclassified Xanthobacter]
MDNILVLPLRSASKALLTALLLTGYAAFVTLAGVAGAALGGFFAPAWAGEIAVLSALALPALGATRALFT